MPQLCPPILSRTGKHTLLRHCLRVSTFHRSIVIDLYAKIGPISGCKMPLLKKLSLCFVSVRGNNINIVRYSGKNAVPCSARPRSSAISVEYGVSPRSLGRAGN